MKKRGWIALSVLGCLVLSSCMSLGGETAPEEVLESGELSSKVLLVSESMVFSGGPDENDQSQPGDAVVFRGGADAPANPDQQEDKVIFWSGESPDQAESAQSVAQESQGKAIIVYFSRHGSSYGSDDADAISSSSLSPGNTVLLANLIQEATGAEMFQLTTVEPYPKDYTQTTTVAQEEQRENTRRTLSVKVENLNQYDVVYLGYPIWWGQLPTPVVSFLEEHDLAGKTVVPFCTHEGSGLGTTAEAIGNLCPDATVTRALAVSAGNVPSAKAVVAEWLDGLDIQ